MHFTPGNGLAFLSDLSEWDIARTQASWLALTAPDVSADLATTLITMSSQVRGVLKLLESANLISSLTYSDTKVELFPHTLHFAKAY